MEQHGTGSTEKSNYPLHYFKKLFELHNFLLGPIIIPNNKQSEIPVEVFNALKIDILYSPKAKIPLYTQLTYSNISADWFKRSTGDKISPGVLMVVFEGSFGFGLALDEHFDNEDHDRLRQCLDKRQRLVIKTIDPDEVIRLMDKRRKKVESMSRYFRLVNILERGQLTQKGVKTNFLKVGEDIPFILHYITQNPDKVEEINIILLKLQEKPFTLTQYLKRKISQEDTQNLV